MAQFSRPTSDVALDGWTNPSWSAIDEVTADDADKTSSPSAPTNDELIVGCGSVTDPAVSTGHVVRYRFGKSAAGGAQINLTVGLYVTNTLIAEWSHTNISDTKTTVSQTLTTAQTDAITDYTALRLRFKGNQV